MFTAPARSLALVVGSGTWRQQGSARPGLLGAPRVPACHQLPALPGTVVPAEGLSRGKGVPWARSPG